jgi:alpha-L-fucosidase
MRPPKMSRRDHLRFLGTSATALAGSVLLFPNDAVLGTEPAVMGQASPEEQADRERRMKWWHEARFGMFIH